MLTIITPTPAVSPMAEANKMAMFPNATMLRGTMFQLGQLGTHVFVRSSQKNLSAHIAGHSVLLEVVFSTVSRL